MPALMFRDDDIGYTAWLAAHPSGWVVNAKRNPTRAYLKLHRADCPTISELKSGYGRWTTGQYMKACAEDRADLDTWAETTLAAALEDGCSCVQYPATGARPPPQHLDPSTRAIPVAPSTPVLADNEGFRTVEAPGVIPFEPKDPVLVEAREEIRSALASMAAQPGELLHGVVEGPAAAGTDLDNALLYNIGGRVAAAARNGVALERRPGAAGAAGVRYRYRLTPDPAAGETDGASVAELHGVELGRQPRLWPDVWAAVRMSRALRVVGSAPVGELALRLRVGAPRFAGAANGQFVKTLVDGVLTALHAHGDASTAAEIGRRLAAHVPISGDQVTALLLGDDRAVLGTCRRLIVLRDRGIQCQPEDGRLAAVRIAFDRSATSWTLTGRVASCGNT
jgi:hypothetical protein